MLTHDELRRDYADLFSPRFQGFQCETGWSTILGNALAALRRDASNASVVQVKEKLGTLRIVLADRLDPVASAIVHRAETESATTCDVCGAEGQLIRSKGPVRTRCRLHQEP